jgi:MFS family permease
VARSLELPSESKRSSARGGKSGSEERGRGLSGEEKARLAILALPTFACALANTTVGTYLSEVARRYTQQTVLIGAIVGVEGVMALWVPLISGAWSDKLRTPIGGRLPFVIAGAIPAVACLALIGFVHSLSLVALVAAGFFACYFLAYEPYRAMYPDLLDEDQIAGRAQGTQAVARGVGTGCALLGGGLLLSIARPAPFVAAAVILLAATGAFVALILRRGGAEQHQSPSQSAIELARTLPRMIVHDRALRAYLIANALWETALSALKAFVILYLTIGLRYRLTTSSLIVGCVAVVILVGAVVAGNAGDRYGRLRVARIAVLAYGLGYMVPIFTTSRVLIVAAIPFIAVGGGAVMTMAYAILMPLMPEDEHGALTAFYSLSRGLGTIAGPIVAGTAIALTSGGPFRGTHGFQAMWIVCAAAALTSQLFIRRLRSAVEDRRALEVG